MLVTAALLLAVPSLGLECLITDGKVSNSCFSKQNNVTQQLVTAKVPLDLRVQWGQVSCLTGWHHAALLLKSTAFENAALLVYTQAVLSTAL